MISGRRSLFCAKVQFYLYMRARGKDCKVVLALLCKIICLAVVPLYHGVFYISLHVYLKVAQIQIVDISFNNQKYSYIYLK